MVYNIKRFFKVKHESAYFIFFVIFFINVIEKIYLLRCYGSRFDYFSESEFPSSRELAGHPVFRQKSFKRVRELKLVYNYLDRDCRFPYIMESLLLVLAVY